MYLLKSLPMAYLAGIRVKEFSAEKTILSIQFSWLTQNPFRSIYFACLAMAAEISTGLLVMNGIYNSSPKISMLVTKNQSSFFKKAVGKISFTCSDGKLISEAIQQAKQNESGITIDVKSVGVDEAGDTVAEFFFTWSLKAKNK
ncbi:MAG: DUF4442 domain-containing protein [Bacteroidia bacterium]